MNPIYIGLRFLETLFNGDVLHSAMHNFPVQTIAMVYRRTGQMFRVFCCFGWVSALVSMIPFSKASAAGWIFRGAFLPLLVLYYFILNDIKIYLMPGTVYDIVNTHVTSEYIRCNATSRICLRTIDHLS